MKKIFRVLLLLVLAAALLLPLGEAGLPVPSAPGAVTAEAKSKKKKKKNVTPAAESRAESGDETLTVEEDGTYTSKEEVALYIHTYGHLPDNYITKREAEDLGWKSGGLDLDEAAPGMSIGGSRFGNYEGLLPEEDGRQYYECDIDYEGGRRNAKRIVYSNDGLIFYTDDHYESFEQLY